MDFAAQPDIDVALLAAEREGNRVIIDLVGVPFLASGPIGRLLRSHHVLSDRGGALALVMPSSHLQKLFERLGICELMHIFESQAGAIAYLVSLAGIGG
jgi:anti-anti-sigma factor